MDGQNFSLLRKLITFVMVVSAFGISTTLLMSKNADAATGINQQINFQGRLLNAQGAVVPDGYYNIQFKIYQDGDGQSVGNTTGSPAGTLEWTESHLNQAGQGVQVKNGFMSVQLGSVTAFGSLVDWDQDTLWISMNIGNTNGTCTPFTSCAGDGEMIPMKRLSATPYAMNAGRLGGLTSAGFIQNTTSVQTANIAVQSASAGNVAAVIQGAAAQTADIFQVKANGVANSVLAVSASGATTLQPATDGVAFTVKTFSGVDVLKVDTSTSRVGIGAVSAAPATTLHVAVNNIASNEPLALFEQKGSGDSTIQVKTIDESWFVGADSSDGSAFKINSGATAGATGTFGNTTTGDGSDSADNNIINAGRYTSGVSGSVTTLSVNLTCAISAAPNNQFRMGLYTDNGSGTAPATLLTQGQGTLSPGWNQISVPAATVANGTIYWITYNSNGLATNQNCFRVNTSGGTARWTNTVAFGTMPGTWPGTVGSGTSSPSFYAGIQSSSAYDSYTNSLFRLSTTGRTTIRNSLDSSSAFNIQNAAGSNTLTVDTTNNRLAVGAGVSLPSATLQVAGTLTSAGGAISLNDSSNFAVSINGGSSTGALTLGNSANTTTLGSNTINLGNATAATTLSKTTQTTANTAGQALTIRGATGNGTGAGGTVTLQGGNGGVTNANGGNLTLSGGTATGTGSGGLVVITTPTFQTTTNDANCFTGGALVTTSCTIAASSVNNSSAVIVGFSTAIQTATLPDPTITTAGRIVYVTAANGSVDFTLSVNGGGTGNQIAMRQNTSATMIWNGVDWTAAGASSSTTLQSAYDNTLQSAGGAELVVSKTSSTNGLTIRESTNNPVNGTLLSVQSASAASLFSVNSDIKEYVSNGGAETAGGTTTTFPANTWGALAGTTTTRQATAGSFIATGQGSVSAVTGATANTGITNRLTSALSANTNYSLSFTTRLASGTFTDMNVFYSIDGTAASVSCTANAIATTSVWSKVNCAFTTPASGITANNAIFIRQTTATARTFYVDNLSVTIAADYNFATDSNVSDGTNFATNWLTAGLGTVGVTRNTSDGFNASDSAQAAVTTGAANAGIRNKLSSNPLSSTLYRVTVYGKLISGAAFNDFKIRYSYNGSTNTTASNYVDCVDYNTQTLTTTGWSKVTCYINTDVNIATNPHVYFVETASAVRTFAVDAFSMTLRTSTTPNVQIGGGVNGGPTTLLTLDKGASAPIASDNDALLGSMYYDTTLGKLQCYEADGWGACGSSPDNVVTISPEYTNAVMHGTGIGTMTSDLCSDTLNINDGSSSQPTICGANETYNFYKWTSPQASAQTYGIYVTYQLPSTFKEFASGQTSLMGRTDNANSTVNYQIYRSNATGLTACGSAVAVSTGVQSTWQTGTASGAADPSTCSFAPGNSIVFKINMTSSTIANAYVGNLNFTYSNR